LSKRDDIERMVAVSVEALGGLDMLVNNADINGHHRFPLAGVRVLDGCCLPRDAIGTFHVTRLSIPHLKKSAAGSIIVMFSLGGRFGYPNRSAYCTAKMGLIGFAKTPSRELGQYNSRQCYRAESRRRRPYRTRSSGSRRRRTGWPNRPN
jgi:NAD(P)-dependent dehydrogenase (short-subunit alcohol dehydrogenase family)